MARTVLTRACLRHIPSLVPIAGSDEHVPKIMIIEESALDMALLSGLMRKRSFECIEVRDGKEAMASARAEKPDLILLGLVGRGQDAFSSCRALKRDPQTRTVPVVLISGRTSENDRFWGKRNGATAYLCKPFSAEQLHSVVNIALAAGSEEASGRWSEQSTVAVSLQAAGKS